MMVEEMEKTLPLQQAITCTSKNTYRPDGESWKFIIDCPDNNVKKFTILNIITEMP